MPRFLGTVADHTDTEWGLIFPPASNRIPNRKGIIFVKMVHLAMRGWKGRPQGVRRRQNPTLYPYICTNTSICNNLYRCVHIHIYTKHMHITGYTYYTQTCTHMYMYRYYKYHSLTQPNQWESPGSPKPATWYRVSPQHCCDTLPVQLVWWGYPVCYQMSNSHPGFCMPVSVAHSQL